MSNRSNISTQDALKFVHQKTGGVHTHSRCHYVPPRNCGYIYDPAPEHLITFQGQAINRLQKKVRNIKPKICCRKKTAHHSHGTKNDGKTKLLKRIRELEERLSTLETESNGDSDAIPKGIVKPVFDPNEKEKSFGRVEPGEQCVQDIQDIQDIQGIKVIAAPVSYRREGDPEDEFRQAYKNYIVDIQTEQPVFGHPKTLPGFSTFYSKKPDGTPLDIDDWLEVIAL